jgi:GntR family phosphonate transport system transcriptional regulator
MSLFSIERNQGTAIYAQIARILETEFVKNGMPGDRLPSEGNLAEQFGVNRHTLRRAVDELISAGMLERLHGIGVFVSEKHLDYKLKSKTRFTQTLHDLGMTTDCEVMRKNVIEAPKGVADALKLQNKRDILWIDTLRYADGIPLCVISHFLPLSPFGDSLRDYNGGSLHEVLNDQFGPLFRLESLVTAVVAPEDDAKLLRVGNGQPVLRVKSLNVLEQDKTPVEYAVTRFRADMIQLRIDMNDSVNHWM